MTNAIRLMRQIRSFVRRDSRMTKAQQRAIHEGMPTFGLSLSSGFVDFSKIFNNDAPCVLEIGFGMGHSLLQVAKENPTKNFIGIETHLPGIGHLLSGIEMAEIKNIRVYHADAVQVLTNCILDDALTEIQIFFPDPWPKRRHHKRRLIQNEFIQLLLKKLKMNGILHLATDWEDYAKQMMEVLSSFPQLKNMAGMGCYALRSMHRPILTRFELRGQKAGHVIRELQFQRIAN